MKILMLGWEYPPHISGGLGTACEGLTKALALQGVTVDFVIPRLRGGERASHMNLIGIHTSTTIKGSAAPTGKLSTFSVPSYLRPYMRPRTVSSMRSEVSAERSNESQEMLEANAEHYGVDLYTEVERYAELVLLNLPSKECDVIHVHDWMTFPAGLALAERLRKPLVAHVHSLEYDRAGEGAQEHIVAIEQLGFSNATQIVAVSNYTKSIIVSKHSIPEEKVQVVHNGVQPKRAMINSQAEGDEKLVLFMGRITFQKGPEYFVHAAAKVIERVPTAKFVMAGDGDMLPQMKELVTELGMTDCFQFPGFLRGKLVEEMYAKASVYVMPSVSEPFGIAPLEAINCSTPVIISRQSGVSEVLNHALRVDFWDVDKLALYITNALLFPELRRDMVHMAQHEVRRIRWESAAQKLVYLYEGLI